LTAFGNDKLSDCVLFGLRFSQGWKNLGYF